LRSDFEAALGEDSEQRVSRHPSLEILEVTAQSSTKLLLHKPAREPLYFHLRGDATRAAD
jgi:hypothetical protein